MGVAEAASERRARLNGPVSSRTGRRRRRSIVAKQLIGSRVLLALYFTIFLNQLDKL